MVYLLVELIESAGCMDLDWSAGIHICGNPRHLSPLAADGHLRAVQALFIGQTSAQRMKMRMLLLTNIPTSMCPGSRPTFSHRTGLKWGRWFAFCEFVATAHDGWRSGWASCKNALLLARYVIVHDQ